MEAGDILPRIAPRDPRERLDFAILTAVRKGEKDVVGEVIDFAHPDRFTLPDAIRAIDRMKKSELIRRGSSDGLIRLCGAAAHYLQELRVKWLAETIRDVLINRCGDIDLDGLPPAAVVMGEDAWSDYERMGQPDLCEGGGIKALVVHEPGFIGPDDIVPITAVQLAAVEAMVDVLQRIPMRGDGKRTADACAGVVMSWFANLWRY